MIVINAHWSIPGRSTLPGWVEISRSSAKRLTRQKSPASLVVGSGECSRTCISLAKGQCSLAKGQRCCPIYIGKVPDFACRDKFLSVNFAIFWAVGYRLRRPEGQFHGLNWKILWFFDKILVTNR